jgi:hypothetical protein
MPCRFSGDQPRSSHAESGNRPAAGKAMLVYSRMAPLVRNSGRHLSRLRRSEDPQDAHESQTARLMR